MFMDENGVSVDRDGGRLEEEIVEKFKWRFRKKEDYKTAVKISAGECRDIETFPNPVGNHSNQYHAEIWDSEDTRLISLFKAIKLAQLCKEVQL